MSSSSPSDSSNPAPSEVLEQDSSFSFSLPAISQIKRPLGIGDLGKELIGLHHVFGHDIHRRNNFVLLDSNTIAYATGSSVVIENIRTNERRYLMAIDDGGVGCIAIHPKKKFLAVGCRGYQPNIYIYEYPSLQVVKILRGGADRGYSCMAFNSTGDTLASVASAPDYMLTLWTWTEEKILLHSKAFGQEIYTVRFSEYNPSSLTTSGTGHIRFWKMASTFTGRKLQGSIGKFGKVELSDISAFVELPDGKVVSGTESGAMLLWEGNFIKCRFICPGKSLCHDGEITSIEIDHIKGCIVTAGLDGLMKWWDLEVIDTAEVDSDHSMDFMIQPLSEYVVSSNSSCGIRSVLYHHKTITPETYELLRNQDTPHTVTEREGETTEGDMDTMYILETNGHLKMICSPSVTDYGIPQKDLKVKTLHSSHGSEITCLDCSPIGYIAVTGGLDGKLIFWDIRGRKEIASKEFSVPVTSLSWIPIHIDPTGQSICVGFQDGVCKVIRLNRDQHYQSSGTSSCPYTITQTMVMKPHNATVTHISFSNSSQLLVTAGKDGILFFFHCKQKYINGQLSMYTPLRFIRLKKNSNIGDSSSLASAALPPAAAATAASVTGAGAGAGSDTSTAVPITTSASTTAAVTVPKSPVILCTSLAWSGSCLLMSCSDGIAREVDSEIILASANEDAESYESDCPVREISLKIPTPAAAAATSTTAGSSSSSTAASASGGSAESKEKEKDSSSKGEDSKSNNSGNGTVMAVSGKILRCVYSFAFDNTQHDKYYAAVMGSFPSSSSSSGTSSQTLFSLQESSFQSELSLKEYSFGCYDNSSKDLCKVPQITSMKYGISREFIAIGQLDGTLSLLPVNHLQTYITIPAHNNSLSGGVSCVSLSYDNKFLLSTGYDGLLVIYRLKPIEILDAAQRLMIDMNKGIFSSSKTKLLTQLLDPSGDRSSSCCVSSLKNLTNFPSLYETLQQAQSPDLVLEDIIKMLPEIEESEELGRGAYSIEDAKLKQEEDTKRTAADVKKDKIRVIINKLRKEYEELKYHNSQLPEVIQLSAEELLVDREYFEKLRLEEEKMVTEIHLECEYVMEKSMKLRQKIHERLMGELLVEEMPLYGLRQKKPPKVSSLRTVGLSPEMNELLMKYSLEIKKEEEVLSKAKIDAILASELDSAANGSGSGNGSTAGGGGGAGGAAGSRLLNRGESMQSVANKSIDSLLHQSHGPGAGVGATSRVNTTRGAVTTAGGAGGGGGHGGGHGKTSRSHGHGPSRRELRLQRLNTIQSHLLKKPNENDDDERDISAINHAIKTIGNYSLKSSETYEVPEDQIINAEKKKRQIMMLQEAMIVLRLQFNERFLLLRKLKIEIITKMKQFNLRLKQIHHELDIMNMVNAASSASSTSASSTSVSSASAASAGVGSQLLTTNKTNGNGKQPSSPASASAGGGGGGGGGALSRAGSSTVAAATHRYSDEQIWQPELQASEFPDDRDEVTREEIEEYQQRREKEKDWKKVIPPPHHIFTGAKTVLEGPGGGGGGVSGGAMSAMKGKFLVSKSAAARNPFNRQAIRLSPEEMDGKVKLSSVPSASPSVSVSGSSAEESKRDSSSSGSGSSFAISSSSVVGRAPDTVLCFHGIEKLNHLNHQKLELSIPVLSHIKHCTQHARHLTDKQIATTLQLLHNSLPGGLPSTVAGGSAGGSTGGGSTGGSGGGQGQGLGLGLMSSEDKKLMNEYRHLLIYEKQFIENKITEYIINYDESLEDLRHDRHVLISNLKLSELKLLTYFQEYHLLLTFEEKDTYLKNKNMKYKAEKSELENQMNEIQSKLEFKLEDYSVVTDKLSLLFTQYQNMIPGGEGNPFYEILTKIYKKKIKRIKMSGGGGGGGGDHEGGGGDEEEEGEDSDDDENDENDDDYDDEDVEDICPNGCEVTLYDQIISLREKKLDLDEVTSDLVKSIEELKKSKERFKQREKQIDKDLKISEIEIQNFQRQKQSALNKIEVNIPLRISQIHAFVTSGVLSGPPKEGSDNQGTAAGGGGGENGAEMTTDTVSVGSESVGDGNGGAGGVSSHQSPHAPQQAMTHEEKLLLNANRRSLIAEMDMSSHTVFKTANLERLSERISELKTEILDAKNSLKSLHKEKIRLEKERSVQKEKIELWTDKCHELQMLKFGRLIDLDVLEAGSDRTKEKEGEVAITEQEMIHQMEMNKLMAEYEALKTEYAEVTRVNTEHLQGIASLTDRKLQISYEMNAHSSGNETMNDDAAGGMNDYKDSIEKEKLSTFIRLQSQEIESLKNEITMLRRKETAQFAGLLPSAPIPMPSPPIPETSTAGVNKLNKNFTLPPIPNTSGGNH